MGFYSEKIAEEAKKNRININDNDLSSIDSTIESLIGKVKEQVNGDEQIIKELRASISFKISNNLNEMIDGNGKISIDSVAKIVTGITKDVEKRHEVKEIDNNDNNNKSNYAEKLSSEIDKFQEKNEMILNSKWKSIIDNYAEKLGDVAVKLGEKMPNLNENAASLKNVDKASKRLFMSKTPEEIETAAKEILDNMSPEEDGEYEEFEKLIKKKDYNAAKRIYFRYHPEEVIEFLSAAWSKMNIEEIRELLGDELFNELKETQMLEIVAIYSGREFGPGEDNFYVTDQEFYEISKMNNLLKPKFDALYELQVCMEESEFLEVIEKYELDPEKFKFGMKYREMSQLMFSKEDIELKELIKKEVKTILETKEEIEESPILQELLKTRTQKEYLRVLEKYYIPKDLITEKGEYSAETITQINEYIFQLEDDLENANTPENIIRRLSREDKKKLEEYGFTEEQLMENPSYAIDTLNGIKETEEQLRNGIEEEKETENEGTQNTDDDMKKIMERTAKSQEENGNIEAKDADEMGEIAKQSVHLQQKTRAYSRNGISKITRDKLNGRKVFKPKIIEDERSSNDDISAFGNIDFESLNNGENGIILEGIPVIEIENEDIEKNNDEQQKFVSAISSVFPREETEKKGIDLSKVGLDDFVEVLDALTTGNKEYILQVMLDQEKKEMQYIINNFKQTLGMSDYIEKHGFVPKDVMDKWKQMAAEGKDPFEEMRKEATKELNLEEPEVAKVEKKISGVTSVKEVMAVPKEVVLDYMEMDIKVGTDPKNATMIMAEQLKQSKVLTKFKGMKESGLSVEEYSEIMAGVIMETEQMMDDGRLPKTIVEKGQERDAGLNDFINMTFDNTEILLSNMPEKASELGKEELAKLIKEKVEEATRETVAPEVEEQENEVENLHTHENIEVEQLKEERDVNREAEREAQKAIEQKELEKRLQKEQAKELEAQERSLTDEDAKTVEEQKKLVEEEQEKQQQALVPVQKGFMANVRKIFNDVRMNVSKFFDNIKDKIAGNDKQNKEEEKKEIKPEESKVDKETKEDDYFQKVNVNPKELSAQKVTVKIVDEQDRGDER